MVKKKENQLHSPTLASILMVEEALEKEEFIGKYQLWMKLPRKMMYQTFCLIIDYLEKSKKIAINGTKISVIKKQKQKIIENFIPEYIR